MGRTKKVSFFENYSSAFISAFSISSKRHTREIEEISDSLQWFSPIGKLVFFGNGASNTISSHAVIDFINLTGINCISLNDIGLVTGWSNDFGYETIVERYVDKQMTLDDVLFLISSSGESKNVIIGAEAARKEGIFVVTLTGFKKDNSLSKIGNINLWVDSMDYNIVESIHNFWIVSIAEYYKKVMHG